MTRAIPDTAPADNCAARFTIDHRIYPIIPVLNPYQMKLFVTSLGLGALMLASSATSLATAEQAHRSEQNLFRKKSKSTKTRHRASIRIFPDKVKRSIHVVARGGNERQIDFFVFDQQGTLLEHLKMDSGDHESLDNLDRGRYIYRVFAGDEETASGDFEVR